MSSLCAKTGSRCISSSRKVNLFEICEANFCCQGLLSQLKNCYGENLFNTVTSIFYELIQRSRKVSPKNCETYFRKLPYVTGKSLWILRKFSNGSSLPSLSITLFFSHFRSSARETFTFCDRIICLCTNIYSRLGRQFECEASSEKQNPKYQ